MKPHALLALLILFITTVSSICAQQSHLFEENAAVFYPQGFDSTQTLPSLILQQEITSIGAVPSDWAITPQFGYKGANPTVKIPVPDQVDLYGNGEVIGNLQRNSTAVTLWNTDNFGYAKDSAKRLYQTHPWVMGIRGDGSCFGIIADNTWKQEFVLEDTITIEQFGPASRILVFEQSDPFALLEILAKYTGHMQMPPMWSLGFQQCRWSYTSAERVKEVARTYRAKKLPLDVVWMDIDYMQDFEVFTFDDERFRHPRLLNKYLDSLKIKPVYMIDPGVHKREGYFVYDSGQEGNHWVQSANGGDFVGKVWPGDCKFPDFTRPETRLWWSKFYSRFYSYGVRGVWNDMNEPAVFEGPDGTMPINNWHRGGAGLPGGSHARYHNAYGMLMAQASFEGIKKANPSRRPFLLTRANLLGGQRYAATWTGDNNSTWDDLKLSIPMSLTLGLSGQPFSGPDIGGFKGSASSELLGHWMALAPYYPFSRNHTMQGTADQEPWTKGLKIERVSRRALNRRYRFMGYLYTAFQQASKTGVPIMRPLFMADPTDTSLRKEQEAFLFGQDLLIVPKWSKNPALPAGDWRKLKLEKREDEYQPDVYLRPGAVVPMTKVIQSTEDYSTAEVTLLVNFNDQGVATGFLYEDAGDGYGYTRGEFSRKKFTVVKGEDKDHVLSVEIVDGQWKDNSKYRLAIAQNGELEYLKWIEKD